MDYNFIVFPKTEWLIFSPSGRPAYVYVCMCMYIKSFNIVFCKECKSVYFCLIICVMLRVPMNLCFGSKTDVAEDAVEKGLQRTDNIHFLHFTMSICLPYLTTSVNMCLLHLNTEIGMLSALKKVFLYICFYFLLIRLKIIFQIQASQRSWIILIPLDTSVNQE